MILNNIPFEEGTLTTVIERLYKTMNAMDKATEVNLDIVLERYSEYYDDFIQEVFLPFSFHWTEAILSMKLTGEDNPPVYYGKDLFSGSFENYLFQMAFRQVENTQFLYQVHCATSKEGFRDILE